MTALNRRILLAAVAATATGARPALAQPWPSRPVRIIVPLVPGGTTDVIARIIAEPLGRLLGQPVVVENRPGANGWIANEYVMRERPDGHTLIVNNVSTAGVNSAMAGDRPLVPSRNLAPITNLIEAPQVFVAPADFPAATLGEFVARARAANPSLVFASAGIGSYQHIDMEALAKRAGITMVHLPLRGAGEVVPTMLRGDAQITELALNSTLPQIQAGRLRPLATVAATRLPQLPNTPTAAEAGFPEQVTALWNGLFAPAGTPAEIISTLHAHVTGILRDPDLRASLERQVLKVTPSESPADFAEYVARDVARWTALTRELGITVT
ncbi:MAG: tripartite tricarboxylate transporter substrate binding protein [Rubritepida sp.]|nr:tripartite tricarboxylate transporter substrate binding protein [Rubritepida sp.]